jgi:hypothetical protein
MIDQGKFLDIVFDGPPGHEAGRFVEAEVEGASVNAGEWVERNGYWLLRIDNPTALRAELATARETNGRLNRRCQELEAAAADWKRILALPESEERVRFVQGSLGRALLACAAADYRAELETAREERDRLRTACEAAQQVIGLMLSDVTQYPEPGMKRALDALAAALEKEIPSPGSPGGRDETDTI